MLFFWFSLQKEFPYVINVIECLACLGDPKYQRARQIYLFTLKKHSKLRIFPQEY